MEAGIVVIIVVALLFSVVCFVCGMQIGKHRKITRESKGILNVDCSDPANGAYLYLELSVPIAEVADYRQVAFDVRIIK